MISNMMKKPNHCYQISNSKMMIPTNKYNSNSTSLKIIIEDYNKDSKDMILQSNIIYLISIIVFVNNSQLINTKNKPLHYIVLSPDFKTIVKVNKPCNSLLKITTINL
jgi:hypothetical protein